MAEKKTTKKNAKDVKGVVKFLSKMEPNTETIKLKVSYDEKLQNLFKKVAVTGEHNFTMFSGKDESGSSKHMTLQRTKIKTAIYRGFNSDVRDLLFVKDLIFNGEFEFEFYDVSVLEQTIGEFAKCVHRAIDLINEYSNINQKVEFVVKK